ncbi:hypothetical protein V5740_10645 [Croceibacterium sp. TMG7-5b_MA50]|uniref:hypothetical protein n=1 Tax=Croceibacterium sp. TMG7-5b_MA50 TaxID=3121290 RepID=UPI0032217310
MRYLLCAALTFGTAPAFAQTRSPSLTAEEALANAAARYSTRRPEPEPCPQATGNEIVVCRQVEEWDGTGLRSPTEQAIVDGTMPPDRIPQAPDMFGIPPCEPACIPVGAKPVDPLIIDLKAIPEAPPGSDAARYSGT